MSAKYTFLAWDTPIENAPLKLALLQLANNADDNGFSYYSISKMALSCGMSEKTFQRKIKEMEKMGILKVERRANRSSLYNLIGDEMGVTLCPLQNPEATESLSSATESPLLGDRESLDPNNTPKINPNIISICEIESVKDLYNATIDNYRPNWSKIQDITTKRKTLIKNLISYAKKRIKQGDDQNEKPIDYLERLLSSMANDDFCSGKKPSAQYPNGYRWNFDQVANESNIIKFIEKVAE